MPGSRRDESADRLDAPVRAVFLVGFMGAGKSCVGQALSERLGWRFRDLDAMIEAREGRSIADIFRESGESGFRQVEYEVFGELLARLEQEAPLIVALGGGTFAQAENAALLSGPGWRRFFSTLHSKSYGSVAPRTAWKGRCAPIGRHSSSCTKRDGHDTWRPHCESRLPARTCRRLLTKRWTDWA